VVPLKPPRRESWSRTDPPDDSTPLRARVAAELVRTARGARLQVPLDNEVEGEGYFGAVGYGGMDKTQAEHEAYSTFELTDQDLAAFGAISRSKTIRLSAEGIGTLEELVTLTAELPDLGRVVVEAAGYDSWRPEGNVAAPGTPGAPLRVTARVVASGEPEGRSDRRVRLTFELAGVSTQKGVCNNAPLDGADTRPDLRLLTDLNPGVEVVDEVTARSRGLVQEATLVISPFDYGAWGRLRVTAEDDQGRPVPVTVKGREGKAGAALDVPKDEDGNRVADGWQERRGVLGRPGTDDADDRPEGNGFAGDGLTLYEEYRGFQVKGRWTDTDPLRKDLFVCDDSGLAGAGIALFQAASGLAVHQLTCDELGRDRVVNRWFSEGAHLVAQHGLRIEAGPPGIDPINEGPGGVGPPRTSTRIRLPSGGAGSGARAQQDWAADVAHELGHGVGLRHHGDAGLEAVVLKWVDAGGGERQLWRFTVDPGTRQPDGPGGPLTLRWEKGGRRFEPGDPPPPGAQVLAQGRLLVWELGPQGQASGEEACLMRYVDRGLYRSRREPATDWIPDPAEWRPRSLLCASPAGTGVNAPSHQPEPRYGDAAVGACRRQLVVSDRFVTGEERHRQDLPGDQPLPQPGATP
ncbi:MAG TPA: hypothetical protein VFM45_06830, partial [Anaeromyxobacteraceae bacterium]|nr:hypothetical protein [Anaeromyxobacteraceae bacterium]